MENGTGTLSADNVDLVSRLSSHDGKENMEATMVFGVQ